MKRSSPFPVHSYPWYVQDWRESRWNIFNPINFLRLPAEPACYVMVLNGNFTYIGSTGNLRDRFTTYRIHRDYFNEIITPWGACNRILCKAKFSRKYGDWLMTEARLIRRLQPALNRLGSIGRQPWNHARFGPPLVTVPTPHNYDAQVFASVEEYVSGVRLEAYRGIARHG